MRLMSSLKNMVSHKLFLRFLIFLVFIAVFLVIGRTYADDLDTCLILLTEAREQIDEDEEIIDGLLEEIDEMQKHIAHLEVENEQLSADLKAQRGWYIGATSGYPVPSFTAMGMYKFNKWGFYGNAGYINGITAQAGLFFKFR